MLTSSVAALNAFRRDDRGSIIPTFAIMFFMISLTMGAAVDAARMYHSQSRLGSAADTAAVAAAKALLDGRNSDADVERIATEYFYANLKENEGYAKIHSFTTKLDRTKNSVEIDISADVPMTITKIAGFETVSLPVSSVAIFDQKDIELGLQLDLTGSMGGRKIADLRDATTDLVDILLPDAGTPNKVRIALAPYASGVNAGTYAAALTNGRNGADNCVYDRLGASADTDNAPDVGAYFRAKSDIVGEQNCPGESLVPLSSDKNLLKSTVAAYRTSTTTAGHLGTNFAWASISPKWSGIWPVASKPAAYNDGKTIKAVILMTDGEYNTFDGQCDAGGCTSYGPRGVKSNTHARAMCDNIKGEGVVVYTVGFMISHPEAIRTLGHCASSVQHYYKAENGDELRQAFASIAIQLNNLRLSK